MSTFIINLNDTIAMSDSAIVELAKVINTCQPCVQEAETNCYDVKIVAIICAAIVLVALIAKWALWSWKEAEQEASKAEREAKEEKEKVESERKLKADLLNKHLDFLKENASKDDKWIEEYKEVIASFKKALQSELKKCDVMNCYLSGADKDKIIEILEKQMEFLKSKGFRSNAEAEKEYQRVLAYLIEMSQTDNMDKITQVDLLGEQKDDPSSKQTQDKS